MKKILIIALIAVMALVTLTGCSSSDSETTESASCAKADLATVTAGKLTIAEKIPKRLFTSSPLRWIVICEGYKAEL